MIDHLLSTFADAGFWPKAAVFAITLLCLSFIAHLLVSGIGGNPLELPIAIVGFVSHTCLVVAIVVAMYARLFWDLARLPFHLWRQRRLHARRSRAATTIAERCARNPDCIRIDPPTVHCNRHIH